MSDGWHQYWRDNPEKLAELRRQWRLAMSAYGLLFLLLTAVFVWGVCGR